MKQKIKVGSRVRESPRANDTLSDALIREGAVSDTEMKTGAEMKRQRQSREDS